ncbi:MAG: hypothetical protein RL662_367 [Bacteroidota bacterium]|jgi:glycosyltransferase involved in cell wall biosynthesis
MRFSFITSTYNRDNYIGETLKSVCEQDFAVDDYEIIVVDNNSTDNTAVICAEYKAKYPTRQFNYYKETQQGVSFAHNKGLREAKGEFIVFVDDDETINKDHLSRIDIYLKKYPQIDLFATGVIPVYETGQPKWMSHFTQRLIGGYFNEGKRVKRLKRSNYPGTGHTIIRRSLYDKYGFYKTDLGRVGKSLMGAEDKELFNRLSENNVACYYLPDIAVYHHIPESKTTDDFFERVTYSIGKSECQRTKNTSEGAYRKRLFQEAIKWTASIVLCIGYTLACTPSKGIRLLQFRRNVTKGLLGN